MTLIEYHPNQFHRLIKKMAATRPIARLLAEVLPVLDRSVLRLSNGKNTATNLLTGLPVVWVTTTGAKSGEPHTTPLLVGVDGDAVLLFATNFGQQRNPAWVYNLRAHPEAVLAYKGVQMPYRARFAEPEEKPAYWALADSFYPGYAAYRERIHTREIPIIVLTPIIENTVEK